MTTRGAGLSTRVVSSALLALLGALCWAITIGRAALIIGSFTALQLQAWLIDWHVYAAGAQDLLDRSLYRSELLYPPYVLPVSQFNLPPMAAVLPLPLLPLRDPNAGIAWLGIGWIATGLATWWLVYRCLRLPHAWIWVGAVAAAYAQTQSFMFHIVVGNINDLMLGIVGLFTVLHVHERRALAGVVLGVATATKLWPIVVIIPLARQRRWTEILTALVTLGVIATAFIAWMGPSIIPDAVRGITQTRVPVTLDNPVLWVSWLRERTTWWPDWGAPLVAIALLAIPARGPAAIGLGLLAGLTLVPNLWGHYFPTLAFCAGLIAAGLATHTTVLRARSRLEHRARAVLGAPQSSDGSMGSVNGSRRQKWKPYAIMTMRRFMR